MSFIFALARIENGSVIFCEQDGEGTDVRNAYNFGSLENAKKEQKSYDMYDLIYEVEVEYTIENIHTIEKPEDLDPEKSAKINSLLGLK